MFRNQPKPDSDQIRRPRPDQQRAYQETGEAPLPQASPFERQHARANPRQLKSSTILSLQRTIGNRAILRMLSSHTQDSGNPHVIQAQLGEGRPLDGGVKSRMESAFGADFSHVRTHTDETAAGLSGDLQARAFTVGEHVAFGSGEYQPGTLIGDALIAHELAHVTQQRHAGPFSAPAKKGGTAYSALEEDADTSAVGAVISLWGGVKEGAAGIARNALPRLRSGLQLQRCSNDEKKKFDEAKEILNKIPTGKEALAIKEKYKVDVKAGPAGGGSVYDPSSNSIEIDSSKTATEIALTFVHEMNHAKYANEGIGADVNKLSREDYVKGMVEEEAEGTVKSIEAKMEFEGTTVDVSKTSYPLEAEYRQAYNDAIAAAKAADPKKSEADLKAIGRKAGKARVTKGFMDGEVKGSRSGKTYPDKYGEYWDKVHAK